MTYLDYLEQKVLLERLVIGLEEPVLIKGLGELSDETARASMFSSEYQRMDVLDWDADAVSLLYDLMGEDVDPRKEFILKKVDFSKVRE